MACRTEGEGDAPVLALSLRGGRGRPVASGGLGQVPGPCSGCWERLGSIDAGVASTPELLLVGKRAQGQPFRNNVMGWGGGAGLISFY